MRVKNRADCYMGVFGSDTGLRDRLQIKGGRWSAANGGRRIKTSINRLDRCASPSKMTFMRRHARRAIVSDRIAVSAP